MTSGAEVVPYQWTLLLCQLGNCLGNNINFVQSILCVLLAGPFYLLGNCLGNNLNFVQSILCVLLAGTFCLLGNCLGDNINFVQSILCVLLAGTFLFTLMDTLLR